MSPRETASEPQPPRNWKEALDRPSAGADLLSEAFMARWGGRAWQPTEHDVLAASALHIQIASRISTQRLGYSDGVENTALESLYLLFKITREICDRHPRAHHFEAIAWDVLNCHLRPFTARWHPRAKAGKLAALDASDEFRADLDDLQPKLAAFDDLLLFLRDGAPPPAAPSAAANASVRDEMRTKLAWGITDCGGLDAEVAQRMEQAERRAIGRRRKHYGLQENKCHAIGLALSGGGVRSATFSLGVLVALARRNVLPQFDYLSTVSGGGYVGSFLTSYLNDPDPAQVAAPGAGLPPDAASRDSAKPDGEAPAGHGARPDDPPSQASLTPADTVVGAGLRSDELPFRRKEGEAEALRFIRHRSRYLAAGSLRELLMVAAAQLQGLTVTVTLLVVVAAAVALIEFGLRSFSPAMSLGVVPACLGAAFWALALVLVGVCGVTGNSSAKTDVAAGFGLGVFLVGLIWDGFGILHQAYGGWGLAGASGAAALTVAASLGVAMLGRRQRRVRLALVAAAAVAAPLLLLLLELAIFRFLEDGAGTEIESAAMRCVPVAVLVLAAGSALAFADVNQISPHRHYRDRIAAAFLIRRGRDGGFEENGALRLSAAWRCLRAPYHLINCALNVPDSREPRMQGRSADFFLFSPAISGSPLTGYASTEAWEALAPRLDLATATAISGAAAAPQMGAATSPGLRFWLALLNVRLGQWIQVPPCVKGGVNVPGRPSHRLRPGLIYLLREMTGLLSEKKPFVNVTDGGHIENLGVYELLRRRCKYIVAVDGEQDQAMTFGALTTLQRLAAIDLGIDIDIELDDLRLDASGLSRSHFRFCRIRYPARSEQIPDGIGYLLYVKLSLTGNEGEFIKRYRLDEPAFPHHPTADQFFTEAQFEAYRSLGEHVGERLFLRAIVGNLAASTNVAVEDWFEAIGTSMLEPISR